MTDKNILYLAHLYLATWPHLPQQNYYRVVRREITGSQSLITILASIITVSTCWYSTKVMWCIERCAWRAWGNAKLTGQIILFPSTNHRAGFWAFWARTTDNTRWENFFVLLLLNGTLLSWPRVYVHRYTYVCMYVHIIWSSRFVDKYHLICWFGRGISFWLEPRVLKLTTTRYGILLPRLH